MSLNTEQKSAVEWIVKNILEDLQKGMVLVGAGGTGKTTCIMTAVARLQEAGLKVLLTAPTNKAVKQLEKSAREFGLSMNNVAFQTVHSALGLAMLPNEDRKFAVRAGKGVVGVFDVMIVDECSMVSRYALYDHLLPDCEEHRTYMVYMGDDLQLPPPREPISPVFTDFPVFRLEQNMRQAEGQLLTVNGMLRNAMMAEKPFKAPEIDGQQIVEIKAAHFKKSVVDAFELDTDLEKQRVLAWTNKRVNELNQAIRSKLYGKKCAPYVEEERVVTGSPIKDPDTGDIILGTDEECIVHHVDMGSFVHDEESGADYATIRLVLEPIYSDAGQVIAEVLHEDSVEDYRHRLDSLASEARRDPMHARKIWKQFWAFKEMFADIRHCYCITVHRSQGSTYDRVFVDVKDILRNNNRAERQRLIYVGFSRPRHELLVNKARYVA